MTLITYNLLQVMRTITGKFHQNPLKTVVGVAETRLCLRTDRRTERTITLGKNQLSMTSIKYDHLQVMRTITGKFHQNPLKTVGGVAETSLFMDGQTDKPITIVPLRLMSGDN